MHFIDFLFHLLRFICNCLTNIYRFGVNYVLPAISYILPVLSTAILQLTTFILRIFFHYIFPVLIATVKGITWTLANGLQSIGEFALILIEMDTGIVNLQATLVCATILAIVYFRATEKIIKFCQEFVQLCATNLAFILHLLQIFLNAVVFAYQKIFGRRQNANAMREPKEKRTLAVHGVVKRTTPSHNGVRRRSDRNGNIKPEKLKLNLMQM